MYELTYDYTNPIEPGAGRSDAEQRKVAMPRHRGEIAIGRQQRQFVSDAELGDDRIDRSDLNALAPTAISHLGGFDMIVNIRRDRGKQRELLNDFLPRARSLKSLQQLLKHQACRHDEVPAPEAGCQELYLRGLCGWTPTQRERPDARVHEQIHQRERSDL